MSNQNEDKNVNFEKELINRIEKIEADSNTIKTMSKRDYMVVGIIVLLCLAAVIAGTGI